MCIRLFLFSLFLWGLAAHSSSAQMIADFPFDNTSNMPESLKENKVGPDAQSVHPDARSDGKGVYTIPEPGTLPGQAPALDLHISEDLFIHTESIYLEFDYRSLEDFAWFIFSGFNLFRFAHVNYPDDPGRQGFHVRYSTKANPSQIISSGYVGEPLQHGERALIGFKYDKESGLAFIYKNGQEIWRTPEELASPGYAFHWETIDGFIKVGTNMNGDGTGTPTLYRFRAFENLCATTFPPMAEGIACEGEPATFIASGGEEGQYRWYRSEEEVVTMIEGEITSRFTTPDPYESETYYVSIATENCESPLVPVQAKVHAKPVIQDVQVEIPCGPGTASVSWNGTNVHDTFYVYGEDGARIAQEDNFLNLQLTKDSVIYLIASNGVCESELLPVELKFQALPVLDAGQSRSILKGESVDLMVTGNYHNLYWEPHQSLQYPDSPSPRVTPDSTHTYVVRAISEEGCEVSDSVTVFVRSSFPVPNAFSPNQDGINDTWEIPLIKEYPKCKIVVFNRWGNELFSSEGYREPWDGSNKGNPLPIGTYYYTIQLSEEKELLQGTVMIIP